MVRRLGQEAMGLSRMKLLGNSKSEYVLSSVAEEETGMRRGVGWEAICGLFSTAIAA